jgi:hypothetical protein
MCRAVLCAFGGSSAAEHVPTLGSPWAIPYGDVGAITFMEPYAPADAELPQGLDYAHRRHVGTTP